MKYMIKTKVTIAYNIQIYQMKMIGYKIVTILTQQRIVSQTILKNLPQT